MRKIFTLKPLLVVLFALTGLIVAAQTTTIQVGAGSAYTTIQSAYDTGIPTNITTSGAYIIELQSDYNPTAETYPITLGAKTGASAINSISIKPATGVTKTLSCPNQTINLPGCKITSTTSVTVTATTGLVAGMSISGSKISANQTIKAIIKDTLTLSGGGIVTSSTDLFAGPVAGTSTLYLNGARYVTIDGVDRTGSTQLIIDNPNRIASQSILFKNDASYNTIKNCTVKGASQISTVAVTGQIYDNGTIFIYNTTSTQGNDNNTIDHCDIVDGSYIPVTHVCISGSASATNDNNKITNCNLDNAYLTVNTATLTPGYVVVSSNTTNTEISNNRMYATKTISPAGIYSYGIITTSGTNTTITSNVLGFGAKDGSGTFTIPLIDATTPSALMSGIYIKAGSATVTNNTVTDFNIFCMNFSGIWFGPSTSGSVSGNIINNIKSLTNYNTVALAGIYSQTTNAITFSNNTISNLSNVNTVNTTFAMTKGFYNATVSSSIFSGNKIFNLTAGDPSAASLSKAANLAIGIDASKNITTIERNLIYNINAFSSANTAVVNGIKLNAGIDGGFTIKNNMVRLGTDIPTNVNIYGIYQIAATAATNKFYIYHNSVYIGGTAPSVASPDSTYAYNRTTSGIVGVIDLRNNIFSNQRVQGAAENHYAVGLLTKTDLGTSNYNIYQFKGQFGIIGTANKADLAAWQSALYTGNDVNSLVANPLFIDATGSTANLHVSSTSPALGAGCILSPLVTTDFDGDDRTATSPRYDVGADSYGVFTAVIPVEKSTTKDIYSYANGVYINNSLGETATIYAITGQLVKRVGIITENTFIALPRGLYAVSVKGQNVKVLVK